MFTLEADGSPGKRMQIRIDPSALALEVISIVVAILLAFTVNYLAGRVSNHNNVQRSLHAISAEMAANRIAVGRSHVHHLAKCALLETLAVRGRNHLVTFTDYMNTLDRVMPFMAAPTQDIAWRLAETSDISANFDYTTRADLAQVYEQQELSARLGENLSTDFRPLAFSRNDDFFLVARNAALDCSYLTHSEERLTGVYTQEMKKLGY